MAAWIQILKFPSSMLFKEGIWYQGCLAFAKH